MKLPIKHLIEESTFYRNLVENKEILLSSSTMDMIEACDVKGILGAVLELTKPYESNDLSFGSLVHEAIAFYHKGGEGSVKDFMESHDLYPKIYDEKGYKTCEKAKELVEKYIEQFEEQNPYEVLLDAEDNTMCEIPFKVNLGVFQSYLLKSDIKVTWTGTIDLVVKRHGKIWCLDHKTTKQLGSGFVNKYLRSNQFTGYFYALNKLGEEGIDLSMVEGALINALCVRKKSVEIPEPYQIPLSTRQLPEWTSDIIGSAQVFIYNLMGYMDNFIPTRSSCYKFNKCKYWDVCQTMSPEVRVKILEGDEFVKSEYSVFEKSFE